MEDELARIDKKLEKALKLAERHSLQFWDLRIECGNLVREYARLLDCDLYWDNWRKLHRMPKNCFKKLEQCDGRTIETTVGPVFELLCKRDCGIGRLAHKLGFRRYAVLH